MLLRILLFNNSTAWIRIILTWAVILLISLYFLSNSVNILLLNVDSEPVSRTYYFALSEKDSASTLSTLPQILSNHFLESMAVQWEDRSDRIQIQTVFNTTIPSYGNFSYSEIQKDILISGPLERKEEYIHYVRDHFGLGTSVEETLIINMGDLKHFSQMIIPNKLANSIKSNPSALTLTFKHRLSSSEFHHLLDALKGKVNYISYEVPPKFSKEKENKFRFQVILTVLFIVLAVSSVNKLLHTVILPLRKTVEILRGLGANPKRLGVCFLFCIGVSFGLAYLVSFTLFAIVWMILNEFGRVLFYVSVICPVIFILGLTIANFDSIKYAFSLR